jgi:dihydroceramide fatty acyl 2-hydroxylase
LKPTPESWQAKDLAWREAHLAPKPGGGRLLEPAWLDRLLLRSDFRWPYLVVLPGVLALAWHGARGSSAYMAAAIGALLWTLIEYALHRFAFHARAQGERARFVLLLVHGHHHVWPMDRSRLCATPLQIGGLAALVWAALALLFDEPLVRTTMSGFLLAYVAYEWAHFSAHHGKPRTRVGAWLKRYHLRHHLEAKSRWGISSPLWDWVLRSGSQ